MSFERELGGELLASVSRSFYLSLKFLPGRIRGGASLGYLLARATDTVADTEAVPVGELLELLGAMGDSVQAGGKAPEFSAVEAGALSEGERRLLARFADCLGWLAEVPDWQRAAIRKVLVPIVRGQSDDLERFGAGDVRSLELDSELEQYTYDVAGCVGVFWTDLGFGGFGERFARRPREEMEALGQRYGKGLQLLNILRDFPEDFAAGRCYLPGADPAAGGEPIWEQEAPRWKERCREWLEAAPGYVDALKGRRLRFATMLPYQIGRATLERLEAASWEGLVAGVKVPRPAVKRMMGKSAWSSLLGRPLG